MGVQLFIIVLPLKTSAILLNFLEKISCKKILVFLVCYRRWLYFIRASESNRWSINGNDGWISWYEPTSICELCLYCFWIYFLACDFVIGSEDYSTAIKCQFCFWKFLIDKLLHTLSLSILCAIKNSDINKILYISFFILFYLKRSCICFEFYLYITIIC